jgi:type II secretory pathway pseudopilin PulG
MAAIRRPSFTVIEVIIVMAIFSIVMGIVIQIFIFTSRTQRRSRSTQEAYAEARTVIEAIGREAQDGSIDYGYYEHPEDLAQAVPVAALRDSQGQAVRFRCVQAGTATPCSPATPGQVELCRSSGCASNSWAALTDGSTSVVGLRLWLGPQLDPFRRLAGSASEYQSNEQPWLAAVIQIQPRPVSGSVLDTVRLQATISSRTYQR